MKTIKQPVRVITLAATLAFAFTVMLLSGSVALAAREVRFKEFPFELVKGDRLVVHGIRGSVKLIVLPPGKNPVVRARKTLPDGQKLGAAEKFDVISFSVRRELGMVLIEPKGPSTRQEWIEWSKPGMPELHLEIEAPSAPAEIYWHSGAISSTGWKDSLSVALQNGSLRMLEGEGALHIVINKGDAKVEKYKGEIAIESHAAKVNITSIDGDVRIHNFSGESQVASVKGGVVLRSKSGATGLNKIEGGLDFDNGRGGINGTLVSGIVRGVTDEGNVSLQLAGDPDLQVETQDGAVSIKPPAGIGALLKLSTEEGALVAPDSVQVPKISGPKSVVARLEGPSKGSIVVRAKRGTIRVR